MTLRTVRGVDLGRILAGAALFLSVAYFVWRGVLPAIARPIVGIVVAMPWAWAAARDRVATIPSVERVAPASTSAA